MSINGLFDISGDCSTSELRSAVCWMCSLGNDEQSSDTTIRVKDRIGFGVSGRYKSSNPSLFENKYLLVSFQGSVYNEQSLRKQLVEKGYLFKTNDISELIANGYLEYEVGLFNLLIGKFAIAVFDTRTKSLIIARDRIGEEPLYYFKKNGMFLFSTSLKSVLSSGYAEKSISKKALNQYLQLTYIPAPLSICEGIYKVLPGNYRTIHSDNTIANTQYWNVHYDSDNLILDHEECKTQLRKSLFDAVEETIGVTKSYGTFLSGGIDSTIITGITSQVSTTPIDTFTIGFKEKEYDESNRATIASQFHNTRNHLYVLESDDVFNELDHIISTMEEPFADSSLIPTYMVSRYAKQTVGTVLTGDAGDELFGGYSKYLIGYYSDKYNKLPSWGKHLLHSAALGLPDKGSLTRKLRKVINNAEKDIYEQRLSLMCLGFKDNELSSLLTSSYIEHDHLSHIKEYYDEMIGAGSELSQTLYTDLKVVLEGDMLPKLRYGSSLVDLQTRSPLLHKDIVELAARIPSDYKIRGKDTKVIFKESFRDLIPKELFVASKHGFGVPIGSWLRRELKSELETILDSENILTKDIFNSTYVQTIMQQHQNEQVSRTSELWALYVLGKWLAEYL